MLLGRAFLHGTARRGTQTSCPLSGPGRCDHTDQGKGTEPACKVPSPDGSLPQKALASQLQGWSCQAPQNGPWQEPRATSKKLPNGPGP